MTRIKGQDFKLDYTDENGDWIKIKFDGDYEPGDIPIIKVKVKDKDKWKKVKAESQAPDDPPLEFGVYYGSTWIKIGGKWYKIG